MRTRIAIGVVCLLGIVAACSGGHERELANILGPQAAASLEGAEIVAFQPDPDWKPRAYYVARAMSEAEFRAWGAAAALTVSPTPAFASGVLVPPPGVTPSRWLGERVEGAVGLDAEGTTPRATIWSRWSGGVAYTVVKPTD